MAGMFDEANEFLNTALVDAVGVEVTLTRKTGVGTLTASDVPAVLGRTVFARSRTGDGPSVEWGDRDFLVAAADYTLGPAGEAVEPAEGDRVLDQDSGLLFEVRRIPNEPAWRYSDPERSTLRVHVKRIKDDA